MNKLHLEGVVVTIVVVGVLVGAVGMGGWDMTDTEPPVGSSAGPPSDDTGSMADNANDSDSMTVKNVSVHNRTAEGVTYLDIAVAGGLNKEQLRQALERLYDDPMVNVSTIELIEVRNYSADGASDAHSTPIYVIIIAIVTDDRSSTTYIVNRVEHYLKNVDLNEQPDQRIEQTDGSSDEYTRVSPGKVCKVTTAYYQVDFVVGEPIEELQGPEGTYHGKELIRFAHGSTEEPIVRLSDGEFLTHKVLADRIESNPIHVENGTAFVTFSIAEGEGPIKLSLVSYTKPDPGWTRAKEHLQEFVDADTKMFGTGGPYTLHVDLPDAKVGPCKPVEKTPAPTPTQTPTPPTSTPTPTPTQTPTPTVEPEPSKPVQLEVDWLSVYNGRRLSHRDTGNSPQALFNLHAVKPGDTGKAIIKLHNRGGPSYIWMTGELTANDENGATEPERNVEEHPGGEGDGELAAKVDVTVYYAEYTGPGPYDVEKKQVITAGSVAEVMADLNNGIALDSNPDTNTRNPYPGHETGYLVFEWELPMEVGNEVQSDSVAFSLKWVAQQPHHNDGNDHKNE